MNYNEALEFIHSVSNFFCKPGLERIGELCASLGNPQNQLKFIHVAGTNGKGSLCAFLSEILKNAGYKVGCYTSPYILRFNERIAINGSPISNADLAEICSQIKPICEKMSDKPTEFEIITAIGFEYFKRQNCDIVILECGLGGRFDATNIINTPLVSVITGIDFDHQSFLGSTIEKIAFEKAGIIKKNAPCLWCGNNKIACEVIENECKKINTEFLTADFPTIKTADLSGTLFDLPDYKDLKISLLGLYQPKNAANAVKTIEILKNIGYPVDSESIRRGLVDTYWPARFEKLSDNPIILFDGGHNPEGVKAATKSYKNYFGNQKCVVLSGVMADKDYSFIAKCISEIADTVYTVTPNNPRSLSAEDYAKEFAKNSTKAFPAFSVKEAFGFSRDYAKKNGLPIFCLGSLYLYGEIHNLIK